MEREYFKIYQTFNSFKDLNLLKEQYEKETFYQFSIFRSILLNLDKPISTVDLRSFNSLKYYYLHFTCIYGMKKTSNFICCV